MTDTPFSQSPQLPRESYQTVFEHAFSSLGQANSNVLVFYGEDGIGKTSLLRSLEKQYRDQAVLLNGEGMQKHDHLSVERTLTYLRNDLRRDGVVLQNFDVAFAYYWNWSHPGEAFDPYDTAKRVDQGDVISTLGDLINSVAQDMGKQVPGVGTVTKLSWLMLRYGVNLWQHKELINQLNDCSDPYQILERLPEFLMVTLRDKLKETNRKVAFLIDGYEAWLNETGQCAWMTQMMAIENPFVLWVIAAKAPIEGLPTARQTPIQRLDYAESLDWLRMLGVVDDAIGQTLAIAADGLPLYLQAGVEVWKQRQQGQTPRVEDFAASGAALLRQVGRGWQSEDLSLMRLLSVAQTWDEQLVTAIVQHWRLGEVQSRWVIVTGSPFVESVGMGRFRVHPLLRRQWLESIEIGQQAAIHQWLYGDAQSRYEATQLSSVLQEAIYHGLRGSAVEQAVQWLIEQVPLLQERYAHREAISVLEPVLELGDRVPLRSRAIAQMRLGRSYVELGQTSSAEKVLEQASADWRSLKELGAAEAATTELDLARAYLQAQNLFDAGNACSRAKRVRVALFGEQSLEVAEALILEATILEERSQEREAIRLRERVLQIYALHSEVSEVLRVEAMRMQVSGLEQQNRLDEALQVARSLIEVAQEQLGEAHLETILGRALLGVIYERMGERKYRLAFECYSQALAVGEPVLGADHPKVLLLLKCLARLCRKMGQMEAAEEFAARHNANVQIGDFKETVEAATRLHNLAYKFYEQGEYGKAEPLYLQSLQISQRHLGTDHFHVAASLNNLAELYRSQGRYADAEPLYLRSLKIWQRQLGNDHLDVARSLNNLASLYNFQGRYVEAEPLLLQALEIRQRQLGNDHLDVARSLNNLVFLHNQQGRYAEAEPLSLQALEICQRQLDTDHLDEVSILNNLAFLYKRQGRYAEAEPLYSQAFEICQRQLGTDHPDVAHSLNNLAALYHSQGRYNDAERRYLQSLEINEKKLGSEHPKTQATRNNLEVLRQNRT